MKCMMADAKISTGKIKEHTCRPTSVIKAGNFRISLILILPSAYWPKATSFKRLN